MQTVSRGANDQLHCCTACLIFDGAAIACATAAAAGDALLIRGCGRTDFQEGEQNLVDLTPLIDGGHVSAAKVHASRTRIMHVSMFEWSPCFTRNVQQVHEWGYTFKGLATYVASAALEGSWVADASGSKLTMRGFTSCTPKSECGRDGQATPHMQRTFAHILPRMFIPLTPSLKLPGDAGLLYDSVHGQLFKLPDDTLVYPAHDYKGRTASSIGEEKAHNLRCGFDWVH